MDIKVRYVVDYESLTQAKAALHEVTEEERETIENFKKINQEAQKAAQAVTSSAKSSSQAVKEEAGLINQLKKNLSDLIAARDKSFDVAAIKKFNAEIKKAEAELKDLKGATEQQAVAVNKMGATAKSVGGTIAAVFAVSQVIEFGKKVIEITSQFQKYEAVLKNTLGSATAAAVAQQNIVDVAAKTNFSVQELTDTYVKFANRGVKLTNSELLKLTDIANSTGKSIDLLTEAALDSFTGENERLKEFGITAKKTGETTQFTFKGITTEVKNTQEAVKAYILSLGDLQGVSGSTDAIVKTLGGQISNLGDSFDQLFLTIGKGSGGPLSFIIGKFSDLANATTRLLKGNEQLREEAANKEAGGYIEQFAKMDEAYQKGAEALLKRQIEVAERAAAKLAEVRKKNDEKVRRAQQGIALFGTTQGEITKKSPEELRFDQTIAVRKKELELVTLFLKEKAAKEAADSEKSLGLLAALEKKLKELQEAQKNAFSRDAILDFQDEIELTQAKIADLFRKGQKIVPTIEIDKDAGLNKLKDGLKESIDKFNADPKNSDALKIPFMPDTSAIREKLRQDIEKESDPAKIVALIDKSIAEQKRYYDSLTEDEKRYFDANREREEIAAAASRKTQEEAKEYRMRLRQEEFELGVQLVNALFEISANSAQAEQQRNEEARAEELKRVGDDKQAQAFINNKFDKQQAAIKTKQAEADKAQALFNVAVSTAQGIAKTIATLGLPIAIPFIALAAASGAIQAAVIASRPIPKFAKGVIDLDGPGTGTSDSILARLSKGESVMTAEETKAYKPTLKAIRGGFDPDLMNSIALNIPQMNYEALNKQVSRKDDSALYDEVKGLRKDLKRMPINQLHFDERGFKKFIFQGDTETQILNNLFNK